MGEGGGRVKRWMGKSLRERCGLPEMDCGAVVVDESIRRHLTGLLMQLVLPFSPGHVALTRTGSVYRPGRNHV